MSCPRSVRLNASANNSPLYIRRKLEKANSKKSKNLLNAKPRLILNSSISNSDEDIANSEEDEDEKESHFDTMEEERHFTITNRRRSSSRYNMSYISCGKSRQKFKSVVDDREIESSTDINSYVKPKDEKVSNPASSSRWYCNLSTSLISILVVIIGILLYVNVTSQIFALNEQSSCPSKCIKKNVMDQMGDLKNQIDKNQDIIREKISDIESSLLTLKKNQIANSREEQHQIKLTEDYWNEFLRNEVKQIVHEAVNIYDNDRKGIIDFASESAGGFVVSTRNTTTYGNSNIDTDFIYIWGIIPIWRTLEKNTPNKILQPGSAPGECWAFNGANGSVVVQLGGYVQVSTIVIEHISKELSPNNKISTAPKDFEIFGLLAINGPATRLGNFAYSEMGNPVQTFHVDVEQFYNIVELKIISNHGHTSYTCIYRFRVYGSIKKR